MPYFVFAQLVEEASATNTAKYFMNQGNRSSDKERERLKSTEGQKIPPLLPNADVFSESLDSFCVKNISVLKM